MSNAVRIAVGVGGAILLLGGLIATVAGYYEGLWPAFLGGVAIVAVTLERTRYRSQEAERSSADPGPGGGEPSVPSAPFQATDELFVDPTSGRRLRVYLNPATGERRYHAEGQRSGPRP
jgi:hypothetical protein